MCSIQRCTAQVQPSKIISKYDFEKCASFWHNSRKTTYLKPNSYFLLHLKFVGGPSPSHFLARHLSRSLIDWFFISLSPQWHWYEPTLSECLITKCRPFSYYFLDEQRITFLTHFAGGWCGLLNSSALPRKFFSGFPAKFSEYFLSFFHVCRQSSPLQVKYISLAIIVSRFPRFISCYISDNRLPLGQCTLENIF